MKKQRGISISLARPSWQLIIKGLTVLLEKTQFTTSLEERRRMRQLLEYITNKLDEERR